MGEIDEDRTESKYMPLSLRGAILAKQFKRLRIFPFRTGGAAR